MKYGHIITAVGLLVKAQVFHKNAASEYSRLFNQSFTGGVTLEYTPLQQLYQQLTQRHLCQYFYFVRAEARYREMVDFEVLDRAEGQELAGPLPDEALPFSGEIPPTGL